MVGLTTVMTTTTVVLIRMFISKLGKQKTQKNYRYIY